jgi:ResB-like family
LSTIQLTAAATTTAPAVTPPRRAAGLLVAPKGHMLPCFGLLTFLLVLDVAALVIPFYITRFSDNPWGGPDRMEFLARAMASALAFGFVAAVAADRRNHSGWWFLLGHAGFPLAIVAAFLGWDQPTARPKGPFDPTGPTGAMAAVIAAGFLGTCLTLFLTRKAREAPAPLDPKMGRICRLMSRWGNIWFGMTMMFAIGVAVATGTFLENRYGAKGAQYLVYRSPWFGAIFFAGGVAMLCATFRKYPFRLEQAGWLTVHTGLALVVIGGMSSFLSSVEGDVTIREGEARDTFEVTTQTRLGIDLVAIRANGTRSMRPVLRAVADFDVNPTRTEPERVYEVPTNDGEAPLRIVVDRYFAMGEPYSRWSDDGPRERLAVELGLTTGMGRSGSTETIRLDEEADASATLPFGKDGFGIALFRATPKMLAALVRPEKGPDHGRIVVKDAQGTTVLTLPVTPPSVERTDGAPATLETKGAIAADGLEVRLVAYYDNMRPGRMRRGPVDASPGNPQNPAVTVEITGPKGTDRHVALAYLDDHAAIAGATENPVYGYRASYEVEPRIDLAGPQLLLAEVDGRLSWVFASTSGERTTGEVVAGEDLALPVPAFRIRPAAVYRHLRVDDGFEFKGFKAENQVIRLSISAADGTAAAPIWLKLGSSRRTFALGDRTFAISWAPTMRPLGFSLKLNDFHRDFYPGSTEESSFESYCLLTHPAKFPRGEDIKIDMNHPLRLDGWRLFQSRFGGDGRTTILQVNRDPGLVITYPACAIVTLGLVVVFFMKKTLRLKRQELEMRGARPGRHLAWALGSVAAVGIGPLVFGLYAAFHERLGLPLSGVPAFVFGVALLLAGPITVVWIYARPMSRRLGLSLSKAALPGNAP